jgi:hypothetical protein
MRDLIGWKISRKGGRVPVNWGGEGQSGGNREIK